jgi:hypothetical protein
MLLISALDGGECSFSCLSYFILRERSKNAYWIRYLMCLRVDLDAVGKKIFLHLLGIKSQFPSHLDLILVTIWTIAEARLCCLLFS